MLYRVFLPLVVVGLWSSAFVTAKVGVQYATPFAMLLTRFALVSCLFGSLFLIARYWRRIVPKTAGLGTIVLTALVGLLLHGVYLGSVFFALSVGLSAGLSALIVSLQPLLASGLAIFLFGERLSAAQIVGMVAGISGVVLVLLPKMDGTMPMLGLLSVSIGLVAVTSGTLLQKKIGGKIDLLPSNVIQCWRHQPFRHHLQHRRDTPHQLGNALYAGAWLAGHHGVRRCLCDPDGDDTSRHHGSGVLADVPCAAGNGGDCGRRF